MPVEVALIQQDEVVSLLAALGATVDMTVYPSNMTLLQWISAMLQKLRTPSVSETTQEPPIGDTCAQYIAYLAAVLPTKEERGSQGDRKGLSVLPVVTKTPNAWSVLPHVDEKHVLAMTDYYARVESILCAHSTMPQTSQCGETPTPQTSVWQHGTLQRTGYARHTKYATAPIPAHLKVFYDELYEACWTGDNAAIQELCLPKHPKESKEPIQISVVTTTYVGSVHYPIGTFLPNLQLKLSYLILLSQCGLPSSSLCIVVTGKLHAL